MRATFNSSIAAFSAVTLAGLAVAGCSSSSNVGTSASRPPTASPSPTGMAAKLLTPKDLASGWSVDVTPSDPPVSNTDCPLLNSPLWNMSLSGHGEADMSQSLAGPYLVEQVAIGTSDQVDKAWQSLTGNLSKCTSYTHAGSSGQSTFTMTKTNLPSYGDSSYAFTLNITITGGVNASGDVVAARSGNAIVTAYIAGINGVSKGTVEDVVSKAVAKART